MAYTVGQYGIGSLQQRVSLVVLYYAAVAFFVLVILAPYPAIDESDLVLYDYVRNYQGKQFIQHDRPEHLDMRRIVHGYFTPKAMESGARLS